MKGDIRSFFCALAILSAVSCTQTGTREASWLLGTVPSRSVEVMDFRHAGKGLGMVLDSTHAFRRLDLGKLSRAAMVLSYDYSAAMVPLLGLDAGHTRGDTSVAVVSIMEQAPALGLHTAYVVDSASMRAALLLSPSTAAISEALTHIKAGTGIMDAPRFGEALSLVEGDEGFVVLRNSSAGHWLPADLPAGPASRRELVKFLSGAGEWTVIGFPSAGKENLHVRVSGLEDKRYFLSQFEGRKGGVSKIGSVLPDSVSFVVDLPLDDWKAGYDARRAWLDANSVLLKHDRECAALASASGVNVRDWASRMNPQEVALVGWDGRKVLLLRTRSKLPKEIAENKFSGYMSALFGSIFSLQDESAAGSLGGWLVLGSAEDVAAFTADGGHSAAEEFSGRGISFNVFTPGGTVSCKDGDIRLNIK